MFYFTADTHFGHENVIRFCGRPFTTAAEMDEALVENWNSRVKGNDTVFILGDLFFRSDNAEEILRRLKGKKRLLVGNHDGSWMTKVDVSRYFASIDLMLELSDGRHALTLCHYPLLTWKHAKKSYMVHGHIHNDTGADFWPLLAAWDNVLNAGVDINGYQPSLSPLTNYWRITGCLRAGVRQKRELPALENAFSKLGSVCILESEFYFFRKFCCIFLHNCI